MPQIAPISDRPFRLPDDPLEAFRLWFREAEAAKIHEPNAMTLATASPDGRPRARIVLLKEIQASGLDFFTNYESDKGRELAANPFAAATFHWKELRRQARFEGRVIKLSFAESDAYFQTRARGSRLGAWASPQSQGIAGREELMKRLAEVEARFPEGTPVPCPPNWGGFRLIPLRVEFWEERPHRLHERLAFARASEAAPWATTKLAP